MCHIKQESEGAVENWSKESMVAAMGARRNGTVVGKYS